MKPFSQNQNVSNVKSTKGNQCANRKTVVFKQQQSMKYTESVNESGFLYDQDSFVAEAEDSVKNEENKPTNNCMGAGIGGFMQQNINSAFEDVAVSKEMNKMMTQAAIEEESF